MKPVETPTWPKNIGAITLFVEDLQRSKQFYADVFDVPMVYEDASSAVFKFSTAMINLLVTTAAHSLIEPAGLPVAMPDRACSSRSSWITSIPSARIWPIGESSSSTGRWTGSGVCAPPASPTLPAISGRSRRSCSSRAFCTSSLFGNERRSEPGRQVQGRIQNGGCRRRGELKVALFRVASTWPRPVNSNRPPRPRT